MDSESEFSVCIQHKLDDLAKEVDKQNDRLNCALNEISSLKELILNLCNKIESLSESNGKSSCDEIASQESDQFCPSNIAVSDHYFLKSSVLSGHHSDTQNTSFDALESGNEDKCRNNVCLPADNDHKSNDFKRSFKHPEVKKDLDSKEENTLNSSCQEYKNLGGATQKNCTHSIINSTTDTENNSLKNTTAFHSNSITDAKEISASEQFLTPLNQLQFLEYQRGIPYGDMDLSQHYSVSEKGSDIVCINNVGNPTFKAGFPQDDIRKNEKSAKLQNECYKTEDYSGNQSCCQANNVTCPVENSKQRSRFDYALTKAQGLAVGFDGEYPVKFNQITEQQINLFFSYFKGRSDVFSLRSGKENSYSHKHAYYPQCDNFWKNGICLKTMKQKSNKTTCSLCKNRKYTHLSKTHLLNHLLGCKADCSDVIGMYVLHSDNTCRFIVFDFDDHEKNIKTDEKFLNEESSESEIKSVTALSSESLQGSVSPYFEPTLSDHAISSELASACNEKLCSHEDLHINVPVNVLEDKANQSSEIETVHLRGSDNSEQLQHELLKHENSSLLQSVSTTQNCKDAKKSKGEDISKFKKVELEIMSLKSACNKTGVDSIVERSRSGSGYHLWIFFSEDIESSLAREFGNSLLAVCLQFSSNVSFDTFDRLMPLQDSLEKGALGNLIALPLQGNAVRQGNSVFVDDSLHAFYDQWQALSKVHKLSKTEIQAKISEFAKLAPDFIKDSTLKVFIDEPSECYMENGVTPEDDKADSHVNSDKTSASDTDNSSRKKQNSHKLQNGSAVLTAKSRFKIVFNKLNVDGKVEIIQSDLLYIKKGNLKPAMINQLKMLSSFSNSEYYKRKSLGRSTAGLSSIVSCYEDYSDCLAIPRGCFDILRLRLNDSGIEYSVTDKRTLGTRISVRFKGKLNELQQDALKTLVSFDSGILKAATGFGKTVTAAALIGKLKRSTLILVQSQHIAMQWIDELEKFLAFGNTSIRSSAPNKKKKEAESHVGIYSSKRKNLTGIIDVVMIPSLSNKIIRAGEYDLLASDMNEETASDIPFDFFYNYGLVIMDECHHSGAYGASRVLNSVNSKYVYGLSATPSREDGLTKKIFFHFGPIRYSYSSRKQIQQDTLPHLVYPRYTDFSVPSEVSDNATLNDYHKMLSDNNARNVMILDDVRSALISRRVSLIVTKLVSHARMFYEFLKDSADIVILFTGQLSDREKTEYKQKLDDLEEHETALVIATGRYIGEGFNFPRLDTLFLAAPLSYANCVEQYLGRLNRKHSLKQNVCVYDYVDSRVRMLNTMFNRRLKAYKKIGYQVILNGDLSNVNN